MSKVGFCSQLGIVLNYELSSYVKLGIELFSKIDKVYLISSTPILLF